MKANQKDVIYWFHGFMVSWFHGFMVSWFHSLVIVISPLFQNLILGIYATH
jgi:hypothetical protein